MPLARLPFLLSAALLACGAFLPGARAAGTDEPVRVFAASSLAGVLDQIAASHGQITGKTVIIVAAGSGALARQITQGAPADIYISAAPDWMDVLEDGGHLVAGSRVDLLSNRLVLIAPSPAIPTPLAELPNALGDGRLAVALPDAVPAGLYARQALQALGLWDALRPRLAPADSARAALAFVALAEASFGIVYATDAQAEPRVQIVDDIPAGTHDPIRYPAALISDSAPARAFLDALKTPEARALFEGAGFEVLTP